MSNESRFQRYRNFTIPRKDTSSRLLRKPSARSSRRRRRRSEHRTRAGRPRNPYIGLFIRRAPDVRLLAHLCTSDTHASQSPSTSRHANSINYSFFFTVTNMYHIGKLKPRYTVYLVVIYESFPFWSDLKTSIGSNKIFYNIRRTK